AAKGILEPMLAETEQEGRDATFSFSGSTASVVPAVQGRTVEWGPLLGNLPGQLTDVEGDRVLPVSYVGRDPELSTEDAERAGIRDIVGEFTVSVGPSGRAQSMIAALAGHFIPAGGTFAMNQVAGTASGDTSADAVATALFNAAFEAGAQGLVRTSRGVDGEQFPAGRDATASSDVGFRNDQGTGLVIDASGDGNSVTVRLWGTREYSVQVSTAPRADIRRADSRVDTSADCTPVPGADGYTAPATRVGERGDETVSSDNVSSTYPPRAGVGCGGDPARPTPAPGVLAAPGGARTAAARPGRDPGAPAHRTAGAALPLIARRRPCRSGGGAAHQGGVAVVGGATGTTDAFLAVGRHVDQAARAAAE